MRIAQQKALREHGYPEHKLKFLIQDKSVSYCIRMGLNGNDEYSILAKQTLDSIDGIPSALTWKRKCLLGLYRIHPGLFDLACLVFHKRVQ